MSNVFIVLIAFVIDCLIGDPVYPFHPIRLMGKLIKWEEEKFLQGEKEADFKRGMYIVFANLVIAVVIPILIVIGLKLFGLYFLADLFKIYMVYSALAGRDLISSTNKVKLALEKDIYEARSALSMIVGRDTDNLNQTQIIRATVETAAENASDGIIAPLFYIFLCGPFGGIAYKMVNTMDSMIGYKNERYEYFGKFAALTDDVVNYLPARITAFLFIASAYMLDLDFKRGYRVMRRDAKLHKSPNAGYPESAMAGILQVKLLGPTTYKGITDDKPFVGDDIRAIDVDDITLANRVLFLSQVLFIILGSYLMFRGVL